MLGMLKNQVRLSLFIALLAAAVPATPACVDDIEDFDDEVEFRPDDLACPPCYVDGNVARFGIGTGYNPSNITNLSVTITNSGGSELRDYGSPTVPYTPNTLAITDNELCTVGTTGQPPTKA